jgi:hypothetical protein
VVAGVKILALSKSTSVKVSSSSLDAPGPPRTGIEGSLAGGKKAFRKSSWKPAIMVCCLGGMDLGKQISNARFLSSQCVEGLPSLTYLKIGSIMFVLHSTKLLTSIRILRTPLALFNFSSNVSVHASLLSSSAISIRLLHHETKILATLGTKDAGSGKCFDSVVQSKAHSGSIDTSRPMSFLTFTMVFWTSESSLFQMSRMLALMRTGL